MTAVALEIAEHFNASVFDMRFIKPLDTDTIRQAAQHHHCLISIEDGVVQGGVGEAIGACLRDAGLQTPFLPLGIPNHFQEHGSRDELMADAGLDAAGLSHSIQQWMKQKKITCGNSD